jgi:PTS system N-acetylgalactosamine-specific IIA component
MLGIILCGHGGFATGMEKAMKQILGEQTQFIAIDFPETSTTAQLTSQLEQAVAELEDADGIIFLTDLLGGTPFQWPPRWQYRNRAVKSSPAPTYS